MKENLLYGTLEYFEQKRDIAELTVNLVREAIAIRLQSGRVMADELRMYADAIEGVERTAVYENEEYEKKLAETKTLVNTDKDFAEGLGVNE